MNRKPIITKSINLNKIEITMRIFIYRKILNMTTLNLPDLPNKQKPISNVKEYKERANKLLNDS